MAPHSISRFDNRMLVRLATWGTGAAAALTLAGLATISDNGLQRIDVATTGSITPARVAQHGQGIEDPEAETRRLNDAIRLLAADRDRLLNRVSSLERNVDDITGSIKRQAQQPPLPPIPGRDHDITSSLPEIPPATRSAAAEELPDWLADEARFWPDPSIAFEMAPGPEAQTDVANAPMAIAPGATRTEFGIDIGSGANLQEIRNLWTALRAKHGRLLAGLRPIVSLQEDRSGATDIRLIVGPIANANDAAKLCARLGAANLMCATRPFEGQRLAER